MRNKNSPVMEAEQVTDSTQAAVDISVVEKFINEQAPEYRCLIQYRRPQIEELAKKLNGTLRRDQILPIMYEHTANETSKQKQERLESNLTEAIKRQLLAKAILKIINDEIKEIEGDLVNLLNERSSEEKMPLLQQMIARAIEISSKPNTSEKGR